MKSMLIAVAGTAGTGKSTFLLSGARWALGQGNRAAIACVPVSEADGYPNEEGVLVKSFSDYNWNPRKDQYKATGFNRLLDWLEMMETPQYKDVVFVGIDTMSATSELAEHECLSMEGVGDPSELDYGRGYIGTTRQMRYLMDVLNRLCYKHGKFVVCSFHVEMKEMEGIGNAVSVKDMKSGQDASGERLERLKFEEKLQPILQGQNKYRSEIRGKYSLWLEASCSMKRNVIKYTMSSVPSIASINKSRVELTPPEGAGDGWNKEIPNSFEVLVRAIEPQTP